MTKIKLLDDFCKTLADTHDKTRSHINFDDELLDNFKTFGSTHQTTNILKFEIFILFKTRQCTLPIFHHFPFRHLLAQLNYFQLSNRFHLRQQRRTEPFK